MKLKKAAVFISFCATLSIQALPSHAALPVFDVGVLKNIAQLKKQFDLLKKQYALVKSQLEKSKELVKNGKSLLDATRGSYGYGHLINSAGNFINRGGTNSSWNDTLHELSGGNQKRYQELLAAHEEAFPTISGPELEQGSSQFNRNRYEASVAVNRASVIEATKAFDSINDHLKVLEKLTQEIDASSNANIKSSMDLNSRIVAEIAFLNIQSLKMQALLNQQVSEQTASRLSGFAKEAAANHLPED